MIQFFEYLSRGIKVVIRDLLGPAVGLYLAYRLGSGEIQNPALIPVVGGLATRLIFGPYWLYQDRQNRSGNDDGKDPKRKPKRVTITKGGITWSDDDDADNAGK